MNVQLLFLLERPGDEVTERRKAVVEREKITEYLLNPNHLYGASKARFFGAFGFRADQWWTFAEALLEHRRNNDP